VPPARDGGCRSLAFDSRGGASFDGHFTAALESVGVLDPETDERRDLLRIRRP